MTETHRRLLTPPQQSTEQPLLVGVREAAQLLAIGRDATYQLVREGRLRSVSVNRRLLIPRTELAAFVEREAKGVGPSVSGNEHVPGTTRDPL